MKIAKKTLSMFLSLLMIFSACSVALTGLTVTASAATGTVQSVKNALTDFVANEIVYKGTIEHNSYTYTGDADVVTAVDEIYAYAMSLRKTGTWDTQNSTAGLLNAVANNTGFTSGDKYTALKYVLDPPGDVITAIELCTPRFGGDCDGCEHIGAYNTIPTMDPSLKTVKVHTTIGSLVSKYGSLDNVPASRVQGLEYQFSQWRVEGCQDVKETVYEQTGTDCDGNPTYGNVEHNRCYGYRWNYLRSVHKTEIKNIVSFDELKEYGETLAEADLTMTFEEMIALPAADLQAIYDENYGPYQAMIDKYGYDSIRTLFGSYNEYFDNLLGATQVNLALPAVDILMANVDKTYDSANYDEMAAIYAPTNTAYNTIKGFGSVVFDYIATKAEYADFDLAAAATYLAKLKKDMDTVKLPGVKTAIEADLATYENADLNAMSIGAVKTLLGKLNSYKGTINAADATVVNQVMGTTVARLDSLIAKVKANIDARSPAETEAAFNVQYSYYTPLIFGNYSTMATADVMAMYSDYQTNYDALVLAYNEQVEKYGAAVVNPLFSVTIGNGQPTLLQTAVSSIGTTGMKAELAARNSAQLATLAGYKGMASSVDFNNFTTISTAVKNFDQSLYQFCADNSLLSASDNTLYTDAQTVITNYNAFVNQINNSGYQKVELDKNGVYVVRDVYDTDLVKDEAYTVSESTLNSTIVKLDNFLASEDFGALLGFEDANGNPVGLGDYLYGMIGDLLFKDDLINMVVGMLFPMIEDLLMTMIPDLLNGDSVNPNGVLPNDRGALGYVDIKSLLDAATGGIDIYLNDYQFTGQSVKQQSYEQLLGGIGLKIFPKIFADSMVSSGVITTSSETYKELAEAGASWTNLGEYDPETDTFAYNFDFDWGVTDKASFAKAFGGVLDAVKPLLPTAFLNQVLDLNLGNSKSSPAGVGYGSIAINDIPIIGSISISNEEFYASLPITLQPLNLYPTVIQPLFKALGLNANASLSANSKGIDYANAILNPVFELLDKIAANPLDTILGLLPSLAEILATNYIDEILSKIVIDVSVKIGIIGSSDGIFNTAASALQSLLKFEVYGEQLGIADITGGGATIKDLLGIDISNINNLLDFLFEKLGVALDLPDLNQGALIRCAKWNSAHNLTADKTDVLFFLLDYIVSALNPEFVNAIIGMIGGGEGEEPSEILTNVLNTVTASVAEHPDDVIAAIVELLNPVEYELKEMTWAEGADEPIVYLHYANDWTKSESQYLIDNALTIVQAVLKLVDPETEMTDIGAFLTEKVNGLFADKFTNETITKLVETFATMEPLADILNDILVEQLGVNMGAWANDFGYLFNEELAKPETAVLGVSAVKDEEGNIVWNGLVDGDRDAFIDTLCALFAPFAPAVAFLFGGEDLGVFGVIELKGYDSFDASLGLLLETLGIAVPDVDFAAEPMVALNTVIDSVFAWLDATLASDNLVEIAVNAVADLLYFVESNGLSVLINNLLLPVLALVDTVRPLLDVDVNTIVSVVVSDLINGNGFSLDKIISLVLGTFEGNDDITVSVTIDNLTLTDVLEIADTVFGSDLVHSSLVGIGLKGICNADIDAADALTIILSALIDCLGQPAAEEGVTNAQAIFAFVEEKTGKEDISEIVTTVLDLIGGIVYEYSQPNWGYMFGLDEEFNTVLPEHSIVYLGYTTDWTEETADAVYDSLEGIVEMVFDKVPALQGKTITTLVNGLLDEKVYSDEILTTVVEALVNLLASLDATLFETVDVVLDTDISTWFTFCTLNEETGEYECTKDWGVDESEDKKATFVAAIKEVLAPANSVLAWLFFGESYEFLTDSEKDASGNYTYKSLITLNGGEGYAKGLVPILEALGCEMKPASAYLVDGKYNVPNAVEDIFNAALALVDKVSAAPVEEVFKLLPNLIYFINADGVKSSVNNLLAPVNAILEKLAPIVGDISIGGLLVDKIGFDITDITMDTLLGLAANEGFVMSDKHVNLLKTFYIGELEQYTSANGDYAYRMVYTDEESAYDMLTIVLSLALELFKLNEGIFADLLGAEIYDAVVTIMAGYTGNFTYIDPNWAYMYGGDVDKLIADNLPAPSDVYLEYSNDWTELTAETLTGNLGALVNAILKMTGKETTIGAMIQEAVAGNLFKDEIVNKLLAEVVKLLAGLDTSVVQAAGAALGADLDVWFDYCEITRDEEGKVVDVVCTEDWGIDEAEDKAAAFADAFETALAPANRLLAWLLFGQDYTFFNGSNEGEVLITIKGGEGYDYGLVPLLEALGCTVKGAASYKNEDGSVRAAEAFGDVITAICAKIDTLCNGDTVGTVIGMLPNIIYFISADGAKTVVNNLVQPVMFLLEALKPAGVNLDLVELVGFDIFNLNWDTIFGIIDEKLGVTLTDDAEALIKNFYIGTVEHSTSANGRYSFYMTADAAAKRDMITIILSVALETLVLDSNKDVFVDLMGEDIYNTIVTVIAGAQSEFEYADINWAYMYEGEDALAQLVANNLPARTEENKIMYTQYTNNWNKETADYLAANLSTIVNAVISGMKEDGSTVGTMLEAAINDNLYKDEVLNSLLAAIVKLLAGLDYALVDSVGALLSADIDAWFDFCEIERDEEGKVVEVVCTKDWGIDEAEDKAAAFVDAVVTALEPANRVLAWLFFGKDYTFLNNANGDNLITISGGNGYAEGLAPLLSALGCTMKPATDYVVNGDVNMSAAVRDVITALCSRITDVCSDDAIGVVLDLLPNLIYFINADGAKVVVNNLLQPAYFLLEQLSPLVGEINLDELVGFPISDIDFDTVFGIVGDKLGIYFPEKIQNFITSFYLGEVEQFTGANGEIAFNMVYSETETRAEMLTILVSLVLDVFSYSENSAAFKDLLGEDVYNAIMSVLELKEAKPMQDFDWLYTEYADSGKTFTPVETTQIYTATYNDYWTKDKAQYLVDHAGEFVLNILHVLNLEINGVKMSDIETVINTLLSDLYSQANADAVLNLVKDLVSKLSDLEPYGDLIKSVAKSALGVDLTVWDNMVVTVEDGNRDSFEAAIGQIFAPVVPVLEILLTSKDVSFFLDIEGADAITIFGSEGYAYGIIPLLEALGCDTVLTPAEYKAAIAADPAAAITSIIDPLFDRIDEIAADPVNEVLELLPAVIYFVNSNGLDTVVKNLVNSIDTVLVGLEPLVGVTSVVDLLGVDLSTYNFDYLFDMLIDMAAESGFELKEIAGNAINELTIGRVVSYQSKNGETYYTMQYASDRDKADMVTVLLRLIVDFVTMEENLEVFKGMLADVITDADTHSSVCALLDAIADAASEDPNLGKGMAVVFYMFLTLDVVAEGADDIYHDVTNSWEFILYQLETSKDPILNNFGNSLKDSLNKYFDTDYEVGDKKPVIDEEKDTGITAFFKAIADFFKKIGDFFRKLFGMA